MPDECFPGVHPTRRRFVAGAVAAAGALTTATPIAGAQTMTPLRMNIFGGIDAWPVYVMRDKGFLQRTGFDASIVTTQGSVAQIKHMMAGDADIAFTAMDNIIAYDEGMGDPSVAGPFDFFGFLGTSGGFLRLVVRPEITSYAHLRGKTLAVDAVATGFTFVLRRMLEKNGIMPGEYSLVAVGSTQKRFDAMVSGQAVAGVVGTPFDLLGQQKYGFRIMGSALETLGHYQATAVMARRSWAATHRPALVGFVKAYRDGRAWLYDPANRTEAMAILVKNAGLPADLVAQITPAILGSPASYSADGKFDIAGVDTVLELRSAYTKPPSPLGPASKYIDQGYL